MSRLSKDRAAWLAESILPHEPMMRAWLMRKGISDPEIDDIVQETFAILAGLESVDEIRSPRNYAFQVAYSIIQRHVRRARILSIQTFADMDTVEFAGESLSPEREAADRADLRSVEKYIAELPQKYRDVLVLRRIEGLSYREVAERLQISENVVEKLLAKASCLLIDNFGRGKKANRASIGEEDRVISLRPPKKQPRH